MAFVYKTNRVHPSELKKDVPGPGDYIGPEEYNFQQNTAPFLSKSSRAEKANHPSIPKLTNFESVVLNSAKMILQGDSSPWDNMSQDWLKKDQPKATSSFLTKTERYSYLDIKKTPGPGNYIKLSNPIKQTRFVPPENPAVHPAKKIIKRNKSVPSIPSHKHSHGYSEAIDGTLVLNDEPIEEAQELPGERCHDMGPAFHQKKNTRIPGGSWAKSTSKDVASYIHRGATFDSAIGPGSYQLPDPSLPNTGRGSVGFTSTTDRGTYIGQKVAKPQRNSSYRASLGARHSARYEQLDTNNDSEEDEDEFVKDATPGPGYYYNASTASSFRSKISSVKSRKSDMNETRRSNRPSSRNIGVGSRSPRFTERGSASVLAGPGDYNIAGSILKKDITHKAVPFFSGNKRFEKERLSENPGPGSYEPKSETFRVVEKSKSNLGINSFGGAMDRFGQNAKDSMDNEHLGPGAYDPKFSTDIVNEIGENPRPSAIFIARNTRDMVAKEQAPPPGSYTVKNYDIGIKIIREEEEAKIFGVKKVPFGVAKPRFEEVSARQRARRNDEEDDDLDWAPIRSVSSLLQKGKPAAPTAPFASKSKRLQPIARENLNPGPGSYHAATSKGWHKQTFNVNYLGI